MGCGKEIAGDEAYCFDCKSDMRRKRRKRLFYPGGAALILLLLAGAVFLYGENNAWDFSFDSLLQRPVAVVNGEPIAWSEARERFKTAKLILEKEYGKELFSGKRGKALLADMERDVLERMVAERLVAQEARRMNVTISDERVLQEMQNIGREIYGNWENFQASMREDGISQEYLSAHVRNVILSQEIKKAKTPVGVDPDEYFGIWLIQDRRNAKVTFNKSIGSVQVSALGQGSCCGPGGRAGAGGCGGRGGGGGTGCGGQQSAAGPVDPQLNKEASAAALDAYKRTNPAEKDVVAKVSDYGCHVQVDIEEGGRIVKSYAYQDGQVFEN